MLRAAKTASRLKDTDGLTSAMARILSSTWRRQPLHVIGFRCPGRKPERLSEYVDLDVPCHFEPPSPTRILARLAPLRRILKLLDDLQQLLKPFVYDEPLPAAGPARSHATA